MYYFGTDLKQGGHYFFQLSGDIMLHMGLSFPERNMPGIPLFRHTEWPFDPQKFPRYEKGETAMRGEVRFYHEAGYTIFAVCGSPVDKRPGCQSVFFLKGEYSFAQMAEKIYAIPIAVKIMDAFPKGLISLTPEQFKTLPEPLKTIFTAFNN